MANQTVTVRRNENNQETFHALVSWGDFTVVRAVDVLSERGDIRRLMMRIANRLTGVTDPNRRTGDLYQRDEIGRSHLIARWHTHDDGDVFGPDSVEIETTGGTTIDPADKAVKIEVERGWDEAPAKARS